MSHPSCTALSDEMSFISNKNPKTSSPVNWSTKTCLCLLHKLDGHQHIDNHKIKRLKTRKERSQVRGSGEEMSKRKSRRQQHYFKHYQNSKDKAHYHSCCQKCSHCSPSRDAQFSRIIPSANEPSVITDSRLIGHQGLFNHEVKSIDIERLLTEQRKLKNLKRSPEKNTAVQRPQPHSYLPSSCSSNDANVANPNENNANFGHTKIQQDFQKDILASLSDSQRSDTTPCQRQSNHPDVLSEGGILSPTIIPPDVSAKSKKAKKTKDKGDPQMASSGEQHNLTLQKNITKDQFNSHIMEHTPRNQGSSHNLTHSCPLSLNLPQVFNSLGAGTGDRFESQQQRRALNTCVPSSVSAVALRLCHSLKLPSLNTRLLVSESRGVLLQALQDIHGPQLQENLLSVQRHLSFGASPIQGQDMGPPNTDRDHSKDGFSAAFQMNGMDQSCFHTQETASLKRRKPRFSRLAPPQPQHSLEQAVYWRPNPTVEEVGDILDDLLKPSSPTTFCLDINPSGAASPNHVFAPQLNSHWRAEASLPQPWKNGLNWDRPRDSDCFEDYSQRPNESGSRSWESRRHPFLNYVRGQTDGCPASTSLFFQEQDPFYQLSHHPTTSYPRSHHTDMMYYPPSYMLEKDSSVPPSSPSPEFWSFPPMRLY